MTSGHAAHQLEQELYFVSTCLVDSLSFFFNLFFILHFFYMNG